jgi:hypothetical protein
MDWTYQKTPLQISIDMQSITENSNYPFTTDELSVKTPTDTKSTINSAITMKLSFLCGYDYFGMVIEWLSTSTDFTPTRVNESQLGNLPRHTAML